MPEERFPPFLGDFDEKSSRPRTELNRSTRIDSGADPSFIVTVRGYGRSGFGGVLPDDQTATGVRTGFIELAYTQAIAMLERAEHAESNERYLAGYNL